MKKINIGFCCLLFMCLGISLQAQEIKLEHLSTYSTGIFDEGASEIVSYDAASQQVYSVNADASTVDVISISDPLNPILSFSIDVTLWGDGANSIAVKDGVLAVAVENPISTDAGHVVFFDRDGNYLADVEAGVLPDMVVFSPDGTKVLVANEGEPNDDYDIDPEGSVTIVDLSNPIGGATATQVTFEAYNDKKESLTNKGVRIFGPNATVAQDLEPEYIAISEDGSIAYVSCQENNAMVVVDIISATVLDILALGVKDHMSGTPILEEHNLNELDSWIELGTPVYPDADPVLLGGFSGLCYDPVNSDDDTWVFYTVPDRGPNDGTVSGSQAGTSQNLRPFKLPDYQSRIVRFTYDVNSGEMTFDESQQIFLTRQDGTTPISGKGNVPGFDEVPVTYTDDEVYTNADYTVDGVDYHALPYDSFGADFEGIIQDNNGDFWMCDEYRPAIYHFDQTGVLVQRYVPDGTSMLGDAPQPVGTYGMETLPAVYSKRRANRGFEAIAYNPDNNVIYAFIQSPMNNPDNQVQNNSDVIRILGVDASNGQPVEEYVYILERNRDAGVGLSRTDKIGDAVYMGNGRFMILERDSSGPDDGKTGRKYVFEIDLKGATNILGTALSEKMTSAGPNDKTLEMMTTDELVAVGVKIVFKRKVLNLPSVGYLPSDKPEGLTMLPNGMMVVLNDNDFGLAGAGVTDNSTVGLISFDDNYGFDASNEDEAIRIEPRQTYGFYMPDAIIAFTVNGAQYLITANEGDARDYDGYSEEDRVKDLVLDPAYWSDLDTIQTDQELGRLNTTLANGDIDGDGVHEYVFSYGSRSFSIWDANGNLIFDSGDDFEQILADRIPEYFNSTNDDNDSFDNRSDDKGPEPEAIEVATIYDRQYAFIGLERVGGIMVYDITDPAEPEFLEYLNNRNFEVDAEDPAAGDLGIECIYFISANESPNGKPMLVTGNEVSGTVSLFSLDRRPVVSFADDSSIEDESAGTANVEIVVERMGNIPGTFQVNVISASTAEDGVDYSIVGTTSFEVPAGNSDPFNIEVELFDNSDTYDASYLILELEALDQLELGEEELHYLLIADDDVEAPTPITDADAQLSHLGSYAIDPDNNATAEIVAHDPVSQRLFSTNSEENALDILDFSDPSNIASIASIDLSIYGGGVNSVAVSNEIVAVAIEAAVKTNPGTIVFFDTDGNYLNAVVAGVLPDMITFSPDGNFVLSANEGEPNDEYDVDPEGSVSIVDISGGVMAASVNNITFEAFNPMIDDLINDGVRIFGPNATVAQDLEPEYIAFAFGGTVALVSCQENNAIIGIDMATQSILGIGGLDTKDWTVAPNAFDASNRAPGIFFSNWPVKSFRMPDAIATYEVGGETYIVTANEGDSRDYDGYSEEERMGDVDLDPTVFPDAEYLQNDVLLGRLNMTLANGDTDGDGDYDELYAYGGRSFSIWNATTQELVWDSGDQLERIIAADPVYSEIFNATDDENNFQNRSDDKGPEPEAVTIGQLGDKFYAFVALERIGGIMMYDVTDPMAPVFIQYINTRTPGEDEEPGGDLAPEDIKFITAQNSPTIQPLLVVANEVSGTISVFEINQVCDFELGDDVVVCADEQPVTLTAPEDFDQYVWSTTEETQSIDVSGTGVYFVDVATIDGCFASDTISVTFRDTIEIDLGADFAICEGESATLIATAGASTYTWSNDEVNQSISVDEAGTYGVVLTTFEGCTSEDEVTVSVNPLPVVDLGTDTIICEEEAPYVLDAGTGTDYFWNTGDVTQTIEVSETGFYEVAVVDDNGCEGTDGALVVVEICTGTEEQSLAGNLNVYPNPTNGVVFVRLEAFSAGTYQLNLRSITGQQMLQREVEVFGDSQQVEMDLSELASGMYMLEIASANGRIVRKLSVQK
ncbi:MAG: T9SS type A sorting domain-containing protein [Bacteroidetes bacterium]|nr:T9SS type A sorting domain-containing protein [Bacteroidota bacterium]